MEIIRRLDKLSLFHRLRGPLNPLNFDWQVGLEYGNRSRNLLSQNEVGGVDLCTMGQTRKY